MKARLAPRMRRVLPALLKDGADIDTHVGVGQFVTATSRGCVQLTPAKHST